MALGELSQNSRAYRKVEGLPLSELQRDIGQFRISVIFGVCFGRRKQTLCEDFLTEWDILNINGFCPTDAVSITRGDAEVLAEQLPGLLLVLGFDVDRVKIIICGCRHDHEKVFAHEKKLHAILMQP
jgi:hypothetical protein